MTIIIDGHHNSHDGQSLLLGVSSGVEDGRVNEREWWAVNGGVRADSSVKARKTVRTTRRPTTTASGKDY